MLGSDQNRTPLCRFFVGAVCFEISPLRQFQVALQNATHILFIGVDQAVLNCSQDQLHTSNFSTGQLTGDARSQKAHWEGCSIASDM